MCLIGFALDCHPDYRLIVAGNRDEDYRRPTDAAGWWPHDDNVHGGRDRLAGGSWMALNRDGRMAAVTNFRQRPTSAATAQDDAAPLRPSRGALVGDFVSTRPMPGTERERFIARQRSRVTASALEYAGFNLLLFALDARSTRAWWLSNRARASASSPTASPDGFKPIEQPIGAGVHTLSNALLDTTWPKSMDLADSLTSALSIRSDRDIEAHLFEALADRRIPADEKLPDTGVGLLRERFLAPAFIATRSYGTRASTVVLIDRHGRVDYIERSFVPDGRFTHRHSRFSLQPI